MAPPVSPKTGRKKIPKIVKSTRSELTDLEPNNINAAKVYEATDPVDQIQEEVHSEFWNIPSEDEKKEQKKPSRKKSNPPLTPFEQKVKTPRKKRALAQNTTSTQPKTLPENSLKEELSSPQTQKNEKKGQPKQENQQNTNKTPEVSLKKDPEERKKEEERKQAEHEANVAAESIESDEVTKPEEKILGKFKKHSVIFLRKVGLVVLTTGILSLILEPLMSTRYSEAFFWVLLSVLFLGIAFIAHLFISWDLNAAVITEERIISMHHEGVFNHTVEIIPIASIKFIDLKQEGVAKTFFDIGDVHITSFISESSRDLTLENIGKAKKAFTILQKKAYVLYKQ